MKKRYLIIVMLFGCKAYDSTTAISRFKIPGKYVDEYVEVRGTYYPFGYISYGSWDIDTKEQPISTVSYSLFKFPEDSLCYRDSTMSAYLRIIWEGFDTVAVFRNFTYKGFYFFANPPITSDSSMIPLMKYFDDLERKGKIKTLNCH